MRTGEPFDLMLTCPVVETETTKVVPDLSKLDASVVQLPPFEVIGGTHARDLRGRASGSSSTSTACG